MVFFFPKKIPKIIISILFFLFYYQIYQLRPMFWKKKGLFFIHPKLKQSHYFNVLFIFSPFLLSYIRL